MNDQVVPAIVGGGDWKFRDDQVVAAIVGGGDWKFRDAGVDIHI